MKQAHGMAQLNFPTIRLLHETYDKMQHKEQDKKNHNNATMNCTDHWRKLPTINNIRE